MNLLTAACRHSTYLAKLLLAIRLSLRQIAASFRGRRCVFSIAIAVLGIFCHRLTQ
jgi:hypothetical protein